MSNRREKKKKRNGENCVKQRIQLKALNMYVLNGLMLNANLYSLQNKCQALKIYERCGKSYSGINRRTHEKNWKMRNFSCFLWLVHWVPSLVLCSVSSSSFLNDLNQICVVLGISILEYGEMRWYTLQCTLCTLYTHRRRTTNEWIWICVYFMSFTVHFKHIWTKKKKQRT